MTPVWVFPAYPLLLAAPFATNLIKAVINSEADVLVNFTAIAFCAITVQGTGFLISFSKCLLVGGSQGSNQHWPHSIHDKYADNDRSDMRGIPISPNDPKAATRYATTWCIHLHRSQRILVCRTGGTRQADGTDHPSRLPRSGARHLQRALPIHHDRPVAMGTQSLVLPGLCWFAP